jgi:translation initiation factor IF-3
LGKRPFIRRDFRPQQQEAQNRINDQIRVPEVRLVGENMEQISSVVGQEVTTGVYPTRKVREWAERMELDLVEISPNAVPPVVRIVDYNKFLYDKRKKEKELKAKTAKTVLKEIRFGPNTDDHDFEFKVRHAKEFLTEGAKVKAYVQFKGRAIVFKDRGELLLLKFLKELEELGAPESLPKLEGRRMIVIVTPKKVAKK